MKSFIFDVDGTLLSTESMYMKSLQQTLEENGIHKAYEELYAIFGLPSLDALIKFGIENPEEMQRQWQDHYHDFWDEVQLFAGVTDMLADLKATGVYSGVLSHQTRLENSQIMRMRLALTVTSMTLYLLVKHQK